MGYLLRCLGISNLHRIGTLISRLRSVIFLLDDIFYVHSVNLSFCGLALSIVLAPPQISVYPLTSLIRVNTTQGRDFVLQRN